MDRPFVKVIPPGSYVFDAPVMQHVKVASDGRLHTNDLRDFVKRAGYQFAHQIRDLNLKAGDIPVHILAIGATERYGKNRNGDGFKEAVCRATHPTFVKFARLYRNHANKRPDKSYGYIKASSYNEAMHRIELLGIYNGTKEAARRNGGLVADEELEKLASESDMAGSMACVIDPTTPVLTMHGYKAIADVVVGDVVHTHAGNWRRVTALNRRVYSGEAVRIKVRGLPTPLDLTGDHPMFGKVLRTYAAQRCNQRPTAQWTAEVANGAEPFGWLHATHFGDGDRIDCHPVTKIPGVAGIDSVDLAQLLGIYTAEGSLGYNGDVPCTTTLSIHADDWARTGVPALIHKLWPRVTVKLRPHNMSLAAFVLDIYSSELATMMQKLVGSHATRKRIPVEIYNATDECKLAFMGRWLDGDGFTDAKGAHWSSANYGMILQGRDILLSLGIASSIYRIQHKERSAIRRNGTNNHGRTIPANVEYTLNISKFDFEKLRPFSHKVATSVHQPDMARQKQPSLYQVGSTYAYQVTEVERREVVDQLTYNFEVEEDQSYSLMGMSSHNCRVPYDICTGCGNKARNRDEYCRGIDEGGTCPYGGLFNKIATLTTNDDDPILGADNVEPVFFDYSKVARGADRTSFVIGNPIKAASAVLLGGAALAEEWGVTAPRYLEDTGDAADMYKIACKLASIEESLGQQDRWLLAFRERPRAMWHNHGGTMGEALASLAMAKVAMPVDGFVAMVNQSVVADGAADPVRECMPGIFSRLVKSGEIHKLIDENPFVPPGDLPPLAVRRWANAKSADFSVDPAVAEKRLMRNALYCESLPRVKQASYASNGPAQELAKHYASYQLAFLSAIKDSPNYDLTAKLCVVQNHV